MEDYINIINAPKLDEEGKQRLGRYINKLRDLSKGKPLLVVDSKSLRATGKYAFKEIH